MPLQPSAIDRQRDIAASELLLRGCIEEYPRAIDSGRLQAWAKMAHSVVDLLAASQAKAAIPIQPRPTPIDQV